MPTAFFASAPGRAGIIGNPTDMYGGSVVSCSTRERAALIIEPSDCLEFEVGGNRQVVSNPADLHLDGGYFDVARAVVDFLDLGHERFRLRWGCNVPFSAGLSSSSAMIVTLLNGVLAYIGREEHIYRRAEMARHIELHYLVLCGYQDAYMCTFGGLNYMDFRQKQFYRAFGDEPFTTVECLSDHVKDVPLILANTGVKRSSATVHKPIRDRWLEGDRDVVRNYLRIGHLARMGKRALLGGDWEQLGSLMVENHEIQKDLGGSGPENDRLIEAALAGGALGAKLAGAGGGGTIIAVAPNAGPVIESLRSAGASRILTPLPQPGVFVRPLRTKKDLDNAEREIESRAAQEDFH